MSRPPVQVEMFCEPREMPPDVADFGLPVFRAIRATAARKSNSFTATERLRIGDGRLLAAVASGGDFVEIALHFAGEVSWSDVFRYLLRARARGLVADVGDDRWELVDHDGERSERQ